MPKQLSSIDSGSAQLYSAMPKRSQYERESGTCPLAHEQARQDPRGTVPIQTPQSNRQTVVKDGSCMETEGDSLTASPPAPNNPRDTVLLYFSAGQVHNCTIRPQPVRCESERVSMTD